MCGGESRRMGRPKATLPWGSHTMLEQMILILKSVVDHVVVVASPDQQLPLLTPDIEVVHDPVAYQGPLTGMCAGFNAITHQYETVFVTACDTPLLHPPFMRLLLEKLTESDVVMPFDGQYYFPLTAVYRIKPVLRKIEELLAADRHRPLFLFQELNSVAVPLNEIRTVDPDLKSLKNINSLEVYRTVLQEADLPLPACLSKPEVQVEFYGVPRLRTGTAMANFHADNVRELFELLCQRFPDLVDYVFFDSSLHPAYHLMRGTSEFITDDLTRLNPGDKLLLLNVDVGG